MSLVGVIEAGVVDRILQSVAFAGADVLVLCSGDQGIGHVLFERGKIVTARAGELRDDQAVAALKAWCSGHYTLIKRGQVAAGIRGHVALGITATRARRSIARWLQLNGYQASLIANPQQALETIAFLQADLVLTECPRRSMGATCSELGDRLRQEMRLPPAIVAVDSEEASCLEPSPPCLRCPATVEGVEQILGLDWSGTRLGVRLASQEETGKISRPPPRPRPASGTGSEEVLALALEGALRQGRLRGRDLLLALVVLLLGSGAIWIGLLS